MGVPVPEANRVWLELQADLARLSTRSTHLFSDGTHALHETDPRAFVRAIVVAIREVRAISLARPPDSR